jgi:hypothetical protein
MAPWEALITKKEMPGITEAGSTVCLQLAAKCMSPVGLSHKAALLSLVSDFKYL